jgi:hypothetical protein
MRDLFTVKESAEVQGLLFLRNDVSNDLRPQESVEAREDGNLRLSGNERKLALPVIEDMLVRN